MPENVLALGMMIKTSIASRLCGSSNNQITTKIKIESYCAECYAGDSNTALGLEDFYHDVMGTEGGRELSW